MTVTGGLRDRLIHENILRQIREDLVDRGWRMIDDDGTTILNPSRDSHVPLRVIDEYPTEETEEVPLNTIAVSLGDSFQDMLELGSRGEIHMTPVYADFFAENDSLMRHVAGDIYAWVNEHPVIGIWDFSLATPAVDFYVEVEEESPTKDRPARATNPWQKHWMTVSWVVRDERSNE